MAIQAHRLSLDHEEGASSGPAPPASPPPHPLLELLLSHPVLRQALVAARRAFSDLAMDNEALLQL